MGELVVYTTQSIPLEPIIYTLNNGWDHTGVETYEFWSSAPAGTPSFIDAPISSIIAHHRALPETARAEPFVVVDRVDWENEGVLGVNMNYNGTFIPVASFCIVPDEPLAAPPRLPSHLRHHIVLECLSPYPNLKILKFRISADA